MVKRNWVITALAIALLATPGLASAQVTCPVPATFTALGFDIVGIAGAGVNHPIPDLAEAALAVWPGALTGYGDFDTVADYTDEIPLYVHHQLIQAIISNEDTNDIQGQSELVHDIVCQGFVDNAAALPGNLICNSLVAFFESATQGGASKATWASLLILDDILDAEGTMEVAYGEDGLPFCDDVPDPTTMTILGGTGNLLGDDGDVDGDGDTNLDEWQAAVTNNPADFDAATNEFIATALAGTAITVSVAGPGEIFAGFGGTFTAITIDPENPMFTETHTFSSSNPAVLQHVGGGVFMGVGKGTANVIATGITSDAEGTKSVSVRAPAWHETCTIDNDILDEGAALVATLGCLLTGDITDQFYSPEFDLDNQFLAVPAVPDSYQYALLAYTLCAGDNGPDQAAALASHANNIAFVDTFNTEAAALRTWAAPTKLRVQGNPGGMSFLTGGPTQTLTAQRFDQDNMDITLADTFTFFSSNPAAVTVNGGAVAAGIAGATGVTVAAVAEGSATITVVDDLTGLATDEVGVGVDNVATNNISISGASDVNINSSTTYTATTVGPDAGETYTWSVVGGDATIDAMTGELDSGTMDGVTLTVTATGDDSAVVANKSVDVFAGIPCNTAKVLFDPGDEVPTSGPIIENFTVNAIWDGPLVGGSSGGAYGQVLAQAGAGAANALDAGFAGVSAVQLVAVGLEELLGQFEALADVSNNVAAGLGISSEYAGVVTGVLGADAIFAAPPFSLPGVNLFNIDNAGKPLGDIYAGYAGLLTNVNGLVAALPAGPIDALQPVLAAAAGNVPPTITPINSDVVGSVGTKFGGFEPYSGESVFAPGVNPLDLTNNEIADEVVAANGDHFDFVNIAAGITYFGPGGGIFLPVGGALMVGILVGGLAFAGARRVSRRS